MRVKFTVTKADIKRGQIKQNFGPGYIPRSDACPVAQCIRRKYPSAKVDGESISISYFSRIAAPRSVFRFVNRADRVMANPKCGIKLQPFSFFLDIT